MKKIAVIFIFICLFACNDIEDCQLDPYVDFVGFKFTSIKEEPDIIVFDSVRLDGLGVFELDDSTTTLADTIVGNLYLPVDVTKNQSTYWFFTDSTDYFLTLDYEKEAYIYETDCDAGIRYVKLRVSDTNIDSVSLIVNELIRIAPENIEIFL